jgi:hypothetical protein
VWWPLFLAEAWRTERSGDDLSWSHSMPNKQISKLKQKFHHGSGISKLIFFMDSTSVSEKKAHYNVFLFKWSYSDRPYFVSRNSILSMHVCRATIQDCKKNISKFQSVFLIFEIFLLKIGSVFRAKVELFPRPFLVLPKFDWKKILKKFQKKMVQEG